MKPIAVLFLCLVVLIGRDASAQNALTIRNESITGIETARVDVNLDNPGDSVEGFVLAVAYDTSLVSVVDVFVAGATEATGAELVAPEIFEAEGGWTLGVVLDFNPPFDGQEIPAGNDQLIAGFDVIPDAIVQMNTPVPLSFSDGTFNNPPLDNIIVIGGQSIGESQGLVLNDGVVTILPPPPDSLTIESVAVLSTGGPADVRVLMDNASGPVQGFVLAIVHDKAIVELTDIHIDNTVTAAAGAELVVPDLSPTGGPGGTLGVVLDFDPPFDGQTIPVGSSQHIASFEYTCQNPVTFPQGEPPPPAETSALTFEDGILDNPPLDNVLVVGGQSRFPSLNSGSFTCLPEEMIENGSTSLRCGVMDELGNIVDAEGIAGQSTELCFFYTEGTIVNGSCVGDNIQGFQMALSFDCQLNFLQESFTIEGSILNAVGTEFVNVSVDNDPNDGDGCDLTIGILLDALPPFDNQTAPFTCEPLQIGCIQVQVQPGAPCGECLPVSFTDGVDGGENIPLNNVVVIDNQSVQGFETLNCNVCVVPAAVFARGDCNFDKKVDLADAQSTLSQQFQGFMVPCLDACDSNDDGKINLADTVFILNYLFDSGPVPPAPGPETSPGEQGPDPTPDELGCAGGSDCS